MFKYLPLTAQLALILGAMENMAIRNDAYFMIHPKCKCAVTFDME